MLNRRTASKRRGSTWRATFQPLLAVVLACVMAVSAGIAPSTAVASGSGGNGQGGGTGWHNKLPIAHISGGNNDAWAGTPKKLDGSQSKDIDGTIVKYEWDLDANGTWEKVTTQPYATVTWTSTGRFEVRLRVTDDDGATSTDTRRFHVRSDSVKPVAVLTGPSTAAVGQVVTFDGSLSYDPVGSIETYSWDFQSDGVIDAQGTADSAQFAYAAVGTYRVKLIVRDYAGNSATGYHYITVEGGGDATPQKPTGLIAADAPDDEGGATSLSWDASTEADVNRYRVYRSESADGPFVFVGQTPVALFGDTGLNNGTLYYYAVTAVDLAGNESILSDTASVTPLDNLAPGIPTGLIVADAPSDQGTTLVLSWTANGEPDLAGYRLNVRDTVTGGTQTLSVPSSETTYSLEGLTVGRTYEFTLVAYDLSGNASQASAAVSGAPADNLAPAAPAGLTAVDRADDEGGAIVIEWPANTEADLAGYTLHRAALAPGDDPATVLCTPLVNLSAATLSYTDENALLGIDYVYYLVARDGAGNVSLASVRATTRSLDNRAPGAPMDITATDIAPDQGGKVRVDWVPSISADVAGYRVSAIAADGTVVESVEASTTGRSHLFSGLAVGVDYTFSVVAVDAAGNVSDATTVVCAGDDEMAPAKPTDLSAVDVTPDEGGAIVVSWAANSESDLAGYTLSSFTDAGVLIDTYDVGFATSKSFENLTVDATYKFSVVARDINGNSSASTTRVSATANDELAPDPVVVSAVDHPNDQGGAVDVSWTAAPQPDVAGYKLYRDGAEIKNLTGLSWTDPDAGTAPRTYSVKAYDGSDNLSDLSNLVDITAEDNLAPDVPVIVSAVDVPDDEGGAIRVTFAHVADVDVDGYRVFCYDATGTVIGSSDRAALDEIAEFGGLTNGQPYSFKVLAYDLSGNESDLSEAVFATPADNTLPAVPAGLTATNVVPDEGGAINVSWLANTEADLAGYTLTVSDANDAVVDVIDTGLSNHKDFTGLTVGATYKFSVAARDLNGNTSAACDPVSAVAADELAPAIPAAFTATDVTPDNGGAINVSWSANTEADLAGYTLTAFDAGGVLLGTYDMALATSKSFSGLDSSATYGFKVVARDKQGNVSDAAEAAGITAADESAPAIPFILSAVDVAADEGGAVKVTLQAVADADVTGYRVFRANETGDVLDTKILDADELETTFTGLTDGEVYYFTAVAFDGAGNTSAASSPPVAGVSSDNLAPGTPGNLTATPSDTSVELTWAAASGNPTVYDVYSATGTAVLSLEATVTGTSFTDTGLAVGQTYRYAVVARDAAGNVSSMTDEVSAITRDASAPTPPTSIIALSPTFDRVEVSWNGATDNVGVTGYTVQRSTNAGATWATLTTTANTFINDTAVTPATTYFYRIIAHDAEGNSSVPSEPYGVVTRSAPQRIRIENTQTGLITYTGNWSYIAGPVWANASGGSIHWTQFTSGSASYTFTGREITWISTKAPYRGIARVYIDGVLQPATVDCYSPTVIYQAPVFTKTFAEQGTHTIRVEYTGTRNPSASQSYIEVDAFDVMQDAPTAVRPLPPTTLTGAADGYNRINLAWNASTSADVVGYRLERSTNGTTWSLVYTGPNRTHADLTVQAGTGYSYRVTAYDGAGQISDPSAVTVVTTPPDVTAPAQPAAPSATVNGYESITLGWTATTDDIAVTAYELQRSDENGNTWTTVYSGTALTFTDTTVGAGSAHVYRVRARDAAGNYSAPSPATFAATPWDATPPSAPASLIGAALSTTEIRFTWTAATDDLRVAGYRLEGSTDGGATWVQAYEGTALSCVATGLIPGTAYVFRVIALDAAGNESAPTQLAIGTPEPDTQAPEAPTSVVGVSPYYSKIALGWAPAVDNIGTTGYLVERSLDPSGPWSHVASTETTGIVETGLTGSTTYYYRVQARDAAGNWGPFSEPVGVVTQPPAPPVRIENTSSQIAYTGLWTLTSSAISPIYNGSSGQSVNWTQTTNGTASYTFTGSQISWISMMAPYRGIARIYIDGVAQPTLIDCYSPTVVYQVPVFTKTWPDVGTHTIKVECTNTRNPSASQSYIEIDAFAYQP